MYLIVDFLIDINNITTGSNNIPQTNVSFKSYRYDKMYMDKNSVESKLYQIIDLFKERKTSHRNFYFTLLNNIQPLYDGNGRTCKIFLVSNFS